MNRSRSFAVLFDKLSRIERQSRPKYKSAVPNWFIRRTLHVPNLIIRFGTCKVRRLNRALHLFEKIILSTGRDQETVKWGKKFIPMQNTHDLLVGTLSIGIPSYLMLSENFQWFLGNYAVISRNHPQLKAIRGGLNRDLAKLRYVSRKHQWLGWKSPLQKINPNF